MDTIVLKGSNFSNADLRAMKFGADITACFIYPNGEVKKIDVDKVILMNMLEDMDSSSIIYLP